MANAGNRVPARMSPVKLKRHLFVRTSPLSKPGVNSNDGALPCGSAKNWFVPTQIAGAIHHQAPRMDLIPISGVHFCGK